MVAAGERILITNRGQPVAMLVPPETRTAESVREVGVQMLAYRDEVKRELQGSFRDTAHEGHRY